MNREQSGTPVTGRGLTSAVCALSGAAYFGTALLALTRSLRPGDSPHLELLAVVIAVALTGGLFIRVLAPAVEQGKTPPAAAGAIAATVRGTLLWLLLPVIASLAGYLTRVAGGNICLGWLIGPVCLLMVPWSIYVLIGRRAQAGNGSMVLRGTRMLTARTAFRRALRLASAERDRLCWGGLPLPDECASGHFCVTGSTGSGKTVTMRLLMQTVLPRIQPGSDYRAVVYDAKQDTIEILDGLGLLDRVVNFNPFDIRSVAWDIASDVISPATALQVARILNPRAHGDHAFWANSACDLEAAVMVGLNLAAPGEWTLRDVVLTMSNQERMADLLTAFPQTRQLAEEHFERDPRTLANIQSTISANMSMLRPIAAMWERASQRISLKDWCRSNTILLLGNDESLRAPIDAMNRVVFQRLGEYLLAQAESDTRRTWIFFDESKEAGRLEILVRLLTKGRTKGIRGVISFQDIQGFRSVYGQEQADEIAGMCANKAFLRTDSEPTARWASETLGQAECRERKTSHHIGRERSRTISHDITKRDAVLPAEILRLPMADRKRYHGLFVTPTVGVYSATVHFARYLCPKGNAENFIPRPVEHHYLDDWTDEDTQRLMPDSGTECDDADAEESSPSEPELPSLLDIKRITMASVRGARAAGPPPEERTS